MLFAVTLLVLGLVGVVGGALIVARRGGGSPAPGIVIVVLGTVAAALAVALLALPGVPA
ncbi:hypothetical protein [Frigoribacterium endophyticum]|uniref:hypothetical protein n=1 Tax=Frigoribacterium endophyticum TaxID=1522176 RepID=UPI00142041DB|nr:hypothetical protein [Frigoribacterium endophyticum]NII50586.1 VIT1/CCC1 family predicted Fe2+/Mn2+ transporter [Frigoribacterium endophyticum]